MVAAKQLVRDGDDHLSLSLQHLKPTDVFVFTIDVDDTLEDSALGQTRITGSEIEGATASFVIDDEGEAIQARFSSDATAVLRQVPCA